MKTHIAGIPHRKPDLSQLKLDDHVALSPEPDNKFDPNAIRVFHDNVHLGYIPKSETAAWANTTTAKIVEVLPSRKWSEVIIEA